MEGRRRLSRGSVDGTRAHVHPMVGTPELVPEPSTVMRNGGSGSGRRWRVLRRISSTGFSGRLSARYLHEAEAQLGERVFDQPLLFERELPLVFSAIIASMSMAWRAAGRLGGLLGCFAEAATGRVAFPPASSGKTPEIQKWGREGETGFTHGLYS